MVNPGASWWWPRLGGSLPVFGGEQESKRKEGRREFCGRERADTLDTQSATRGSSRSCAKCVGLVLRVCFENLQIDVQF